MTPRRSTSSRGGINASKRLNPRHSRGKMVEVLPEDDELGRIAELVARKKDFIALVGAGISTAAGIDDYRSRGGRYANGNVFLRSSLSTEDGRNKFLEQAATLRDASRRAKPTETHKLFTTLRDKGKLLRLYTQNLDGLEAAVGLNTNMTSETGAPICVLLHGDIRMLKCELCCSKFDWNDYETENFEPPEDLGTQLRCPTCHARYQHRVKRGKRKITVGRLYPSIVCSDDQHPQGVEIERIIAKDQRNAKMLIILGTSLEFYGPRNLARRLADEVCRMDGKVVYVNKTKPRPDIAQFIDYWVHWTCDAWTEDLRKRLIWTED